MNWTPLLLLLVLRCVLDFWVVSFLFIFQIFSKLARWHFLFHGSLLLRLLFINEPANIYGTRKIINIEGSVSVSVHS